MKYFTYNKDVVSNCFGDYIDSVENGFFSFGDKNITTTKPVVISPKTIKYLHKTLKENKESFKMILNGSNFRDLVLDLIDEQNAKLLLLVSHFYDIDWEKLYKFIEEKFAKTHPIKAEIKTNMITRSTAPLNKKGYHCSYAKAVVLAKEGVTLNKFKTYTEQELDKLIEDGSIVIIDKKPYGKAYLNQPSGAKHLGMKTLKNKFVQPGSAFNTNIFIFLKEQYPSVLKELANDLNLDEIKKDYTEYYVPTYKDCIKYLSKCIEVSVASEEKEKIELAKKRDKINERLLEYKELSKENLDISKGR